MRPRSAGGVDLGDVEDAGGASDEGGAVGRVGVAGVDAGAARQILVEHHQRAALGLADLRAEGSPLPVGRPAGVGVAVGLRRAPQGEHIDAAVASAGASVARHRVGAVPGWGPRNGVGGLELGEDKGGNAGVQVGGARVGGHGR